MQTNILNGSLFSTMASTGSKGSRNYKVLCCGSNGCGQLGLGNEDDQNSLNEVAVPVFPESIAFGGNHTIAIGESKVFVSGSNSGSQLGMAHISLSNVFIQVREPELANPRLVSCGWEFSVVVDGNDVYVCGLGLKGELGLGKTTPRAPKFTKLEFEFPARIEQIKSSLNHTIVRLQDGRVYGWGVARKGQLGVCAEKVLWVPTLLLAPPNVVDFAVGRDYTIVVSDSAPKLLFWGSNDKVSGGLAAIDIDNGAVQKVHSMWSSAHIEVRHRDGSLRLASVGNNSHGQMFPLVTNAISPSIFAIGSEHGLVSTGSQVFAWGWGEHGNCGTQPDAIDANEVVFGALNTVYTAKSSESIAGIACGCATSWVIVKTVI